MESGHPLLRDVFPELVDEPAALPTAEGEPELSAGASELLLFAQCDCGDDFCRSLRTAPHSPGRPFGPGHRCLPLPATSGTVVLDVVDDRIVYVELIDRPPLRDARLRDTAETGQGGAAH
ncbi:hypothetical protein [Kitasatospora griseola]|uniref:hypothetical protein n=1 Tax=Kitasatospora griseola TaxID=2064 RepID=UPI0005C4D46F|nr:hypothetical protein [Kitasatospora griseola]